jgi:hypothetical protein
MTEPIPAILDGDHLPETLKRLDDLIGRTENVDRLRSGLGMRLALTMAHELREHRNLGELSTPLVAGWVEQHGQESVDMAVAIAREFLTQPDRLVKEFAARLQQSAVENTEENPGENAAQDQTSTSDESSPLSRGEAGRERGRG